MPYIKKVKRTELESVLEEMFKKGVAADGDLNYILFAYCKRHIKPSYNSYKNFIGELQSCATEIERRLLAPYEDKKIEENGDV